MKNSIQDRKYDSYRSASNDKSKVAVTSEEDGQELILDNSSSTILYLGEGLFGALTSEAKWKIKKIDLTTGVRIKCASESFDQIWDNRASLTYV